MRKILEEAFPELSSHVCLSVCLSLRFVHVFIFQPSDLTLSQDQGHSQEDTRKRVAEGKTEPTETQAVYEKREAILSCGHGTLSLPTSTTVGRKRVKDVVHP